MTLKVSYSWCCMDNMEQIVTVHNKKILNENSNNNNLNRTCSRKERNTCPLNGECLRSKIVYRADVATPSNGKVMTYYGTSKTTFKVWHSNHKQSFENTSRCTETRLAGHIWDLKNKTIDYNISWSIPKQTNGYNPVTESCSLCLSEKFLICLSIKGLSWCQNVALIGIIFFLIQ